MKITDALDFKGHLTIHTFDATGQLVTTAKMNNSIVYTGRDLVAKLFVNEPIAPIQYIAVGTGNKAIDPANDTGLQAEIFRKRLKQFETKDLTDIEVTVPTDQGLKPQKSRKIILSADLDFAEPKPNDNSQPHELREAGLFNAAEKGVMYNRVVFPNISKTKDFKLTLVWEIIF